MFCFFDPSQVCEPTMRGEFFGAGFKKTVILSYMCSCAIYDSYSGSLNFSSLGLMFTKFGDVLDGHMKA